jgi:hypothetical protein
MCDRTIAAGLYSCGDDYCLTCPQAHSCDNSCSLPCGETDDGHRRNLKTNTTSSTTFELQLPTTLTKLNQAAAASSTRKGRRMQDYWQPSPATNDALFDVAPINQIACPLSSFIDRAQEVEAQCCHGGSCPNGMPEDCAFDCGRFFTSFLLDCNQTIHNNFDRLTLAEYIAFGDECSRMDPMSMVRAIDGAFCTTCGDNITQVPLEQCDWGAGNSYEPNACRPDCRLPSCGDGVVDTVYLMGPAHVLTGPTCEQTLPAEGMRFTTLGATGQNGPTTAAGYAGTPLAGQVTLNAGIQTWTVPAAGTYRIEAAGAGNTCGRSGATMAGNFALSSGQELRLLIGQQGQCSGQCGGGSGGTFVASGNTPLIVGGGSGSADPGASIDRDGLSRGGGAGGTDGGGGTVEGPQGCAGGGFRGDTVVDCTPARRTTARCAALSSPFF